MIPAGALDLFGQGVAKTLHEKTELLVGFTSVVSYFEVKFSFKVGAGEIRQVRVPLSVLEKSLSWQPIHDKLVEAVMAMTEPERGPGYTVDEFGRRHFRLKADTGFINSLN